MKGALTRPIFFFLYYGKNSEFRLRYETSPKAVSATASSYWGGINIRPFYPTTKKGSPSALVEFNNGMFIVTVFAYNALYIVSMIIARS